MENGDGTRSLPPVSGNMSEVLLTVRVDGAVVARAVTRLATTGLKTLKLKAAPDSGYGRRAGSDARDAMLADLADQVETADANAFEAKTAAKRAATRAEVRETVGALDERMSMLEMELASSRRERESMGIEFKSVLERASLGGGAARALLNFACIGPVALAQARSSSACAALAALGRGTESHNLAQICTRALKPLCSTTFHKTGAVSPFVRDALPTVVFAVSMMPSTTSCAMAEPCSTYTSDWVEHSAPITDAHGVAARSVGRALRPHDVP